MKFFYQITIITFTQKYLHIINIKNLRLIVFFLLFAQYYLFSNPVFSCETAFQEITPKQLKDRLSLISKRAELIQTLNMDSCGSNCLAFYSQTGFQFQIRINSSLSEPQITSDSSSKTLEIPSIDWLSPISDGYLKTWLIGHELMKKLSLDEALKIFERKGIRSHSDFVEQRKTDPELQSIPANLPAAYTKEGWKGWKHFSGKQKLPLNEALRIFERKGIRLRSDFIERRKTDPELQNIPQNLNGAYQEWQGWHHVRGEKRLRRNTKPPLIEVLKIFERKGIRSHSDFVEQRKTDPELQSIPANLPAAYTKEGWKGWKHFSGKQKLPLNEALRIFERKGIRSRSDFIERRKTDPELQNIPQNLNEAYQEWQGWHHVRGEKRLRRNTKPPLIEVLKIFERKGIRSHSDFVKQRKTDPELQSIPANLPAAYTKEGWKGWKHFSGKQKPPLNEVLRIFERKGIRSRSDFIEQRKTDPELQNIPQNLNQAYQEWQGWKYFSETQKLHLMKH